MNSVINNKIVFLAVILLMSSMLGGCVSSDTNSQLELIGDIDEALEINSMWSSLDKEYFNFDGEQQQGVLLTNIINSAKMDGEYDVYLVSDDRFMVCLTGNTIDGTYLVYSDSFGFCYLSDKHPVNSQVKHISEIIVRQKYEENKVPDNGLHIVTDSGEIHMSIGELLTSPYEIYPYEDGISTQDDISILVMKQKRVLKLSSLVSDDIASVLVMDEKGTYDYVFADEYYVEILNNRINLFTNDKIQYYHDIEGVIINPPNISVMNAFYDSRHYIENDEDVMLIFVDGFSYNQYKYICKNYPDLYLSNIDDIQKATTVYKPVTNAGFAAMITGVAPIDNGVLNREYREVKTDTIFDSVSDIGKSALLIESEVKILNTSSEYILNNDRNGNSYTDDEVYASALENVDKNYNFVLVHFHGVDDEGHNFGPFGNKTLERIIMIDDYIEELVESWDGKVIITSDHGMHQTLTGGDHGDFRHEDMYVPYAIVSGGGNEK